MIFFQKPKFLALIILALFFSTPAEAQFWKKKFIIGDSKFTAKQICGGDCAPGSVGVKVMPMYDDTYKPEVNSSSNEESVALSVLGRVFSKEDYSGKNAWLCSNVVENPFTANDITRLASNGGTTLSYTRIVKSNLDVEASAKTSLEEIKKLNPTLSNAVIQEFEAKLKSAYSRFAGKELTVKGKYSEWGLKTDVLDRLGKRSKYQDCNDYLGDRLKIITAIGLVYFDISYAENSLDVVAAQIQAEAKAYQINGDIAVSFKREVSKDLSKVTKDLYQVIVWRSSLLSEMTL